MEDRREGRGREVQADGLEYIGEYLSVLLSKFGNWEQLRRIPFEFPRILLFLTGRVQNMAKVS